jgi:hypothetical protein
MTTVKHNNFPDHQLCQSERKHFILHEKGSLILDNSGSLNMCIYNSAHVLLGNISVLKVS